MVGGYNHFACTTMRAGVLDDDPKSRRARGTRQTS
jgi:hypothetical protein